MGYALLPHARPGRHDVELTVDVPYLPTGRQAHLLDVYRPRAPRPSPALLYVHGGAFSMLSKDTHRVMALALAARGYAVFNINYRLAPRHPYPAQLEDVAAALLWVVDHAAEWGADPRQLVLAGESAGANLVAAIAYCATHSRPERFASALLERAPSIAAVMALYGLHDLHDIERFWRQPDKARKMPTWIKRELRLAVTNYVQGAPERAPLAHPLRLFAEREPLEERPLPPFFLAAGTRDPMLDDSRRLRDALHERGVDCELHVYPGEIHGFNAMLWRPAAKAKWQATQNFLDRHAPIADGRAR